MRIVRGGIQKVADSLSQNFLKAKNMCLETRHGFSKMSTEIAKPKVDFSKMTKEEVIEHFTSLSEAAQSPVKEAASTSTKKTFAEKMGKTGRSIVEDFKKTVTEPFKGIKAKAKTMAILGGVYGGIAGTKAFVEEMSALEEKERIKVGEEEILEQSKEVVKEDFLEKLALHTISPLSEKEQEIVFEDASEHEFHLDTISEIKEELVDIEAKSEKLSGAITTSFIKNLKEFATEKLSESEAGKVLSTIASKEKELFEKEATKIKSTYQKRVDTGLTAAESKYEKYGKTFSFLAPVLELLSPKIAAGITVGLDTAYSDLHKMGGGAIEIVAKELGKSAAKMVMKGFVEAQKENKKEGYTV